MATSFYLMNNAIFDDEDLMSMGSEVTEEYQEIYPFAKRFNRHHSALSPYWAKRLYLNRLYAVQHNNEEVWYAE